MTKGADGPQKGMVCIEFCDNGRGVNETVIQRVWGSGIKSGKEQI